MEVLPVLADPIIAMKKGRIGSGSTTCSWIFLSQRKAGGFTVNIDLFSDGKPHFTFFLL
jgi:hypothetical protein